uniref:Uncharacterized protein n=1 Tax=Solanum tuberosum TaxID=4113 RepID=M1DNS7_SOLTU
MGATMAHGGLRGLTPESGSHTDGLNFWAALNGQDTSPKRFVDPFTIRLGCLGGSMAGFRPVDLTVNPL